METIDGRVPVRIFLPADGPLLAGGVAGEQLDDALSDPPPYLVEVFKKLEGDVLILGAAGKKRPTLSRMAQRAADAAGSRPAASEASTTASGDG